MRVTMLGCGASNGVPLVGCDCAVCTSADPRNKRSRVSIFVEIDGVNILIDTSPDLRQQALNNGIRRVDAVLFTHDHADHTHGIDDLRSFNYLSNQAIPAFADTRTMESLMQRFDYAFLPKPSPTWYRPGIAMHEVDISKSNEFSVLGIQVKAFMQEHGRIISLGFRIGNMAYSTDVNALPEASWETLRGVEVWIVDCLRYTASPSHSMLAETLRWIERVNPKRAILTHMSHELEYNALKAQLPSGVEPGYDGLVIDC